MYKIPTNQGFLSLNLLDFVNCNMIQYLLAALLLIWASYFLYKTIRKQFSADSKCASGCGSCSVESNIKNLENLKS
jgi:membrane protein DedA with SNARE-associated domain